jgi:hypothetical protein
MLHGFPASTSLSRNDPHRFSHPARLVHRRPRLRRTSALAAAHREVARLRRHFRRVLAELHDMDVTHLSAEQAASRTRLLDELARYARRGRFPKNRDFPGTRIPYFVDADGTRCAVAHLIESTGASALVTRVAAARNNAYIRELAGDGELLAWLDRAGLTVAEAARIQPNYSGDPEQCSTKAECLCSWAGTDALLEVTVSTNTLARVDVVHGDESLAAPGDQITLDSGAPAGTRLLVGATRNSDSTLHLFPTFKLYGDLVEPDPACLMKDVPDLRKADLIDAWYSGNCEASMAAKDPTWGELECYGGGCACTIPPAGVTDSAVPGILLFAAAVMARRRFGARRRARAR